MTRQSRNRLVFLLLEEPIKKLGTYAVPVKLHTDVTGTIKVWVVKE